MARGERRMLWIAVLVVAALARSAAAQGGSCAGSSDCNHGSCTLQKCSCGQGYSGDHCEHSVCDGKDCHMHGSCSINGDGSYACNCRGGWSGNDCEVDPCSGYDCGHGHCHGNKVCHCEDGWQGDQCQTKRPCTGFTPPEHSHGCTGSYVFEDACNAQCDNGYTAGETTKQFKCQKNGRMSGGPLTCEPVSCGNVPAVPHADHSGTCKDMHFYSGKCTVSCHPCYSAGQTTSVDVSCEWTPGDGFSRGHFEPKASDLNCQPVSCGTVPELDEHAVAHANSWSGEKQCSEPPNYFSAKCDAGWTGGSVKAGNREARLQCLATGKYDGDLKCEKVPCHVPVLPPPAGGVAAHGCPASGCPSNVVIPDECKADQKKLHDTCVVACADGFTRSVPSQSTVTYTCVASGQAVGNAAPFFGVWSPAAAGDEREAALQCEAVDCGPLEISENTFDPNFHLVASEDILASYPVSLNNISRHLLDRRQLGENFQCGGHYMGFGDSATGGWSRPEDGTRTPTADGTCLQECLPSYYPKLRPTERKLLWRCQPPTSQMGAKGRWVKSESTRGASDLDCEMGQLDVSKSRFNLTTDAETIKQAKPWNGPLRTRNYPGGSVCQGFPGASKAHGTCFDGYQLAPERAPAMNFYIQAFDTHGQPRNYQTLQRVGTQDGKVGQRKDYLLAIIQRVPLARLDDANRRLQPKLVDDNDCEKTATCSTMPLRQYPSSGVMTSDIETAVSTPGGRGITWPLWPQHRPTKVSDGADGLWKITHEITEHGVFYLSVYLCEQELDGKRPANCTRRSTTDPHGDRSALVPGTGEPEDATTLPSSAFTICPQNTHSASETTQHQVIPGQKLNDCRAAVGFYSPKGAGHIAERCLEGFICTIPGMRWPVASPGYWVDKENPSQMSKCVTKGACPGSSQFVRDAQCPSPLSNGSYDSKKLDFNVTPPFLLQQGCFMLAGDIGVEQRAERNGKPYLSKSCFLEVGHRCCPGATGPKCNKCCTKDMGVGHGLDNSTSCNGKQWHSKGTGEGQHCEECPPTKLAFGWLAFVFLCGLMVLPIIVKLSDLFKHAGAVTGPMLSVLNFIQSADLFQGLDLHWPKFFKDLCREFAQLFNSLNVFQLFLGYLDLPNPECAFQLTYVQKWCLIMLTPIILTVLYYGATIAWILVWHVMGGEWLWSTAYKQMHNVCMRCRNCKGSEDGLDRIGPEPEPEPEPEPSFRSNVSYGIISSSGTGDMQPGQLADTTACGTAPSCLDPNAGHGWQYRMWHNGKGTWREFNSADQRRLNDAVQQGQTSIELKRGMFRYEVKLDELVQINLSTNRVRKIRAPAIGWLYRWRLTRYFAEHDWSSTLRGVIRFLLLYLLVGYTFLAGTALEPIACKADLDTTQWVEAAPSIRCDWCDTAKLDPTIKFTYRTMACFSIAAFVLYGFGVPLLFGAILWAKRDELQSNDFAKSFGFLATKMRTEFYWWEVLISFRKLCLVTATKFSDGQRLPCALINLFVAVAAFGTQVYVLPFANTDANIAEALTLLSTILILVLGLAQKTKAAEDLTDEIDLEGSQQTDEFLQALNVVIYVVMFSMVGASVGIVLRRLRGSFYNWQHLSTLEDAENDGRQIPDEVRKMLHKKWLLVASAWAAIRAEQEDEDVEIEIDDRVRLADGSMGVVIDKKSSGMEVRYVVRLSSTRITREVDTEHCPLDTDLRAVDDGATTTTTTVRVETKEVPRDAIAKEGGIERMERLFRRFHLLQQTPQVQRWAPLHKKFAGFFPEKDLRAMYILSARADPDDIEDLVWVMQQLRNMHVEQHKFVPRCCKRSANERDLLEPEWVRKLSEKHEQQRGLLDTNDERVPVPRGLLGAGLSLAPGDIARETQTLSQSSSPHVNLRQSISQRESRLEEFVRQKQEEEELERMQQHGLCIAVHEYCSRTFFGSRNRAALTALWAASSVFLTVFCFVHMAASTQRTVTGQICQDDGWFGDGSAALILYWSFVLGCAPAVLLWRKKEELRAVIPPGLTDGLCAALAQLWDSAADVLDQGHGPASLQPTGGLLVEHQPAAAASSVNGLAFSRPSSPLPHTHMQPEQGSGIEPASPSLRTSTATEDSYDDGGIDDPNWRTKCNPLGGADGLQQRLRHLVPMYN